MAKRHFLAFQFKRTVLTDFTNAVNAIYLILGFQEVFQKEVRTNLVPYYLWKGDGTFHYTSQQNAKEKYRENGQKW